MTSQPTVAALERPATTISSTSRRSDGTHVRTNNIVPQKRAAEAAVATSAFPCQADESASAGGVDDVDVGFRRADKMKVPALDSLAHVSFARGGDSELGSQFGDNERGILSLATDEAERSTQNNMTTFTAPFPPRPGSHNLTKSIPRLSCKDKSRETVKDFGCQIHQQLSSAPLSSLRRKGNDQKKNNVPPQAMGFYPWTGDHPEDVLSEQAIKSGNYDKLSSSDPHQQIQRETSSAKPFLWPQLKSKPGLQALSAVFVTAMERRQARRRLNTVVALRPPPRVTLTEQKREAWLRDLANPAKELRKLSKSIPHGIRGKALLSQCLAKNVPTARAVWFAKCVGANEMRAFRRKGAGGSLASEGAGVGGAGSRSAAGTGTGAGAGAGEIKWIREWTVQVEQFVEDVIASCGQPDWKTKMNYTLYLAAHVFEHRLLDQDHYLDWLLGSFENATLNSLPMWLFMIKIYWRHLTAYRKFGCRLAEALLAHLINADFSSFYAVQSVDKRQQSDGSPGLGLNLIYKQLCESVVTLITSCKGSIILPNTWHKYSQLLASLPQAMGRPELTPAIQELIRRNSSINGGTCSRNTRTSRRDIIRILDEQGRHLKTEELAVKCFNYAAQDPQRAINTILQWATSIYREGVYRTYLAVRILRIWHRQGLDTDAAIMNFMLHGADRCKRKDIYGLVGNLSRSKDFSVERYLRWLVSHGYTTEMIKPMLKLPCHIELLSELCLQGLPEHVMNLRRTQMSRVGMRVQQEADELQAAKDHILHLLGSMCEFPVSPSSTSAVEAQCCVANIEHISTATKFAASIWLRSHVAKMMSDKKDNTFLHRVQLEADITMTSNKFYTVVDIFEKLGDFPVLADVLGICVGSDDTAILTGVSNTLQRHMETFHAIGAFKKLSRSLLERFRSVSHEGNQRPSRPLERCLVSSLIELEASRFLPDPQVTAELTDLLSRCDQRLMTAVCSPASDNLGDLPTEFDDEIDKILCSGNSMDEQLQTRLFARIMNAFERQVGLGLKQSNLVTYSRWLPMLRSFDEAGFDQKMHGWTLGVIKAQKYAILEEAVAFLVGVGVMSVGALVAAASESLGLYKDDNNGVDTAAASVADGEGMRAASETILRCVVILFSEDQKVRVQDAQHHLVFMLARERYADGNRPALLRLIRQAIELIPCDAHQNLFPLLDSVLTSHKMLSFLRSAALEENVFAEQFQLQQSACLTKSKRTSLEKVLQRLIDPEGSRDFFAFNLSEQITRLTSIVNELSLPFCRLVVRYLHSKDNRDVTTSSECLSPLYDVALNEIKLSIDQGCQLWPELFEASMDRLMNKAHEYAKTKVLDAAAAQLDSPDHINLKSFASVNDLDIFLEKYLDAAIRSRGNGSRSSNGDVDQRSSTRAQLLSSLKSLLGLRLSSSKKSNVENEKENTALTLDDQAESRLYCMWVRALLTLALLHRTILSASKTDDELIMMASLTGAFLLRKEVKLDYLTHQYVYDIAIALSSDLTNEARAQVLRNITGIASARSTIYPGTTTLDPRLQFLFGSLPAADAWPGLKVMSQQQSPHTFPSPSTCPSTSMSASLSTAPSTATSVSTATSTLSTLSTLSTSTASTSATSISTSTPITPTLTPTPSNTANVATSPSLSNPASTLKRQTSSSSSQAPHDSQTQSQSQSWAKPSLPPHTPLQTQVTPQMIQRRRSGMAASLQPHSQPQSQSNQPHHHHQHQQQPQLQLQPHPPPQQILTPFTLKRWDLLPDLTAPAASAASAASATGFGGTEGMRGIGGIGISAGTNTAPAPPLPPANIPNDIARLGMSMFGARRV